MIEQNEGSAEPSLAQQFGFSRKKSLKRKAQRAFNKKANSVDVQAEDSTRIHNDKSDPRVSISFFDYSVENFFKAMGMIDKLCGEEVDSYLEQSEIQRLSASVTFLREWRHFQYEPRSVKFARGFGNPEAKDVINCINLPQFSSAAIPKEGLLGDVRSHESRDSVLYVGGPVWALDWCSQIHLKPDSSVKCEFLAISAHPPGASYHKMGSPLTGRGLVQIWCLLNSSKINEEAWPPPGKSKRGHKNKGTGNDNSTQIKRARGRARKNRIEVAVTDMISEIHCAQALVPDGVLENVNEVCPPAEKSIQDPAKSGAPHEKLTQVKKRRGRPKKNSNEAAVSDLNSAVGCAQALVPDGVLENVNEICPPAEKSIQDPAKSGVPHEKLTQVKKRRGRPKKNSNGGAVGDLNAGIHCAQALVPEGVLENVNEVCPPAEKGQQDHTKNGVTNDKLTQIKKRRGRPKKNSKEVGVRDLNHGNQHVEALAVQIPENSAEFFADGVPSNCEEYSLQPGSNAMCKCSDKSVSACTTMMEKPIRSSRFETNCREGKFSHDRSPPLLAQHEDDVNQPTCSSEVHLGRATGSIPEYVALPRIVLCLAHNGKVAWDVKWRPSNPSDSICKHRMGYLAVLLGSGSLEVWEVPSHLALRAIYKHEESTDPRFIKLEPVFKCSMLKRGCLQSIPLTVEWSVSPPHDYLLAGCHDGTVALWKFSRSTSPKCDDTKPLLCFAGDTVPIRAVAWAPFEGDPESSNIILTAGHEGLKFWDLRDPFYPLRKLHPVPRIIYSLDWLSNPSCIIMTFEDGTMRTLSLMKAANDLPVSGKRISGKKQPGLHSSSRSSFAIWSVHVSRITGMVAYCGADGSAVRFQLTAKEVETDHARNRVPHFLCGSLSEEESALTVITPVSNAPFPVKKSFDKGRHAASSFRGFLYESNVNGNVNTQMMTDCNSNPDSQALVLYNGDNSGLELAPEEALTATQRPNKPKSSGSNKKKPLDRQALVCIDGESGGDLEGDNEISGGSVPEAFPPKIVALHRVRWNMNKGSERWLCYGGAGGVVRCQEIVLSDIDKKYATKR
ncbi:uncharacterized protein LOC129313686 [Prosopis cineraria]|uniref:uncharacterized protein LOC129313686 n=1 Tax=Prosopis cineraria TaxID=364024 RepID=UPI0024109344|nr:uncharacterized protein LOC129313686 [Prosopis cineraria]